MRIRGKNRDAKLDLLRNVSLFSACSKANLSRIASLTDQMTARKGRVLTRQGAPGWEAFIIVEGKAKASMRGRPSVPLGPGDFFGEMSLLDRGPRSATVSAETDMELLVLDSRSFSSLLDDVPAVRRNVMTGMAERLRQAESGEPGH